MLKHEYCAFGWETQMWTWTIRHYIWIFLARNEKGMDLKGCFKSDFNVCAIADYMNLDP